MLPAASRRSIEPSQSKIKNSQVDTDALTSWKQSIDQRNHLVKLQWLLWSNLISVRGSKWAIFFLIHTAQSVTNVKLIIHNSQKSHEHHGTTRSKPYLLPDSLRMTDRHCNFNLCYNAKYLVLFYLCFHPTPAFYCDQYWYQECDDSLPRGAVYITTLPCKLVINESCYMLNNG